VLLGILAPGTAVYAAEFALVPVGATVPYTLIDNDGNGLDDEIVFSDSGPGVEITLEIKLLDWSRNSQGLRTWQLDMDSSTYDNDAGGPIPDLIPRGWPADPTLGAFQDTARIDWVYRGVSGVIDALNTSSLDYLYGATIILPPGPYYTPPPKYGGTLILTVPSGAMGTFRVAFGSQSLMRDDLHAEIEPLLLTPATIRVPEPSGLLVELTVFGALALVAVASKAREKEPEPSSSSGPELSACRPPTRASAGSCRRRLRGT
jgi:hypothetical protein